MRRRPYTTMPETLSALRQTRGAIGAASRVVTEAYFKSGLNGIDEDARLALLSLWAAERRLRRVVRSLRARSRTVKARKAA